MPCLFCAYPSYIGHYPCQITQVICQFIYELYQILYSNKHRKHRTNFLKLIYIDQYHYS